MLPLELWTQLLSLLPEYGNLLCWTRYLLLKLKFFCVETMLDSGILPKSRMMLGIVNADTMRVFIPDRFMFLLINWVVKVKSVCVCWAV